MRYWRRVFPQNGQLRMWTADDVAASAILHSLARRPPRHRPEPETKVDAILTQQRVIASENAAT